MKAIITRSRPIAPPPPIIGVTLELTKQDFLDLQALTRLSWGVLYPLLKQTWTKNPKLRRTVALHNLLNEIKKVNLDG